MAEEEESVLVEKVNVLNTISHQISQKLKKSSELIDDISMLSSSVEDDLIVVHARAGRLTKNKVKLFKVGLFRLRLYGTQEYIAVGSDQKLKLSLSKSSSNEWIFYRVADEPFSGRGGLMHLRSQSWLGMDMWGNPSVTAKQWSAWEELSLSLSSNDEYTSIFFLARYNKR